MPVTGSIDGYGTFSISDEDWAAAKERTLPLVQGVPAQQRIVVEVLKAGPDVNYEPSEGEIVQIKAAGSADPWSAPMLLDVLRQGYGITIGEDDVPTIRLSNEWDVRRYIPGTEPAE